MSFDRTKLLLSFALFGFLIGATVYVVFDWLIINSAIGINAVPIVEVILTPWFLSGIAGSLLSMIIIYVSAQFSSQK